MKYRFCLFYKRQIVCFGSNQSVSIILTQRLKAIYQVNMSRVAARFDFGGPVATLNITHQYSTAQHTYYTVTDCFYKLSI